MQNFHGFHGLASNREGFPVNFFISYYKLFWIAVRSWKFPANSKKIMQPRNFTTANDLHYTVSQMHFVYCRYTQQTVTNLV